VEAPPAYDPNEDAPENPPEPPPEGQSPAAPELAGADSDGEFVRIKRTHLYMALIPLAFVAGLALGFVFWGRDLGASSPPAAVDESLGQAQQPVRVDVSLDDDPSFGPTTAPITIVEFSDFNCPYCKKWQVETFYPLIQAYPDQIHFVYRDFPITSQESFIAAQAANCAGEQGAYWRFHDELLTGDLGLGREAYSQYADLIGIDAQALLACVDSERYADEVEADARYAASLGVSGTPTFFINGIPLVGAQPLSQFTQIIDSELQ
jgi:protein-disulfide isomerase